MKRESFLFIVNWEMILGNAEMDLQLYDRDYESESNILHTAVNHCKSNLISKKKKWKSTKLAKSHGLQYMKRGPFNIPV